MTDTIPYHPAANLFPLMEGDEFSVLVADIAEHGQLEPIVIHDGMILDGRNRYRACIELGIKPILREWAGSDAQSFVVSLNLHRRHLTREQRDEVIRKLRAMGMTLQKIADAVGVSFSTAQRATSDYSNEYSEIENERGQLRPTHYAPRAEPEPPPMAEAWDEAEDDEPEAEYEEPQSPPLPHVAHNGGDNEWYTPEPYISAAVAVMGAVDLDPASSPVANEIVNARTFYTADQDGLRQMWAGKVWMNPPYASELIGKFCAKLAQHARQGDVTEAIVLVNNATETGWFCDLIGVASAVCFTRGRVKFWHPTKESAPLQGQAIIYIGGQASEFRAQFSRFGWTAQL